MAALVLTFLHAKKPQSLFCIFNSYKFILHCNALGRLILFETDLLKIWNEVFSKRDTVYAEVLDSLRPKYGIKRWRAFASRLLFLDLDKRRPEYEECLLVDKMYIAVAIVFYLAWISEGLVPSRMKNVKGLQWTLYMYVWKSVEWCKNYNQGLGNSRRYVYTFTLYWIIIERSLLDLLT